MRLTRLALLALTPIALTLALGATAHAEPVPLAAAGSAWASDGHVASRLLQIRMEVTGVQDGFFRLDPDDFEIWAAGGPVRDFTLDRAVEPHDDRVARFSPWLVNRGPSFRLKPRTEVSPVSTSPFATSIGSILQWTWTQPQHPTAALDDYSFQGRLGRRHDLTTIPAMLSARLPGDPTAMPASLRIVSPRAAVGIHFARPGTHHATGGAAASSGDAPERLTVSLTPTRFQDRRFEGFVQVLVDGAEPRGTWELQASVITSGASTSVWGEVAHAGGRRQRALQDVVEFRPGDVDIIAHARHVETGRTLTAEFSERFKRPRSIRAVGSVSLMQPTSGAVLRAGRWQDSGGSIVLAAGDMVDSDRPLALLTTVCRRAASDRPAMARRSITGVRAVEFEPTLIEPGGEPCVLIEDRVPAGTLGGGAFEYRLEVREAGGAATRTGHQFHVRSASPMDLTLNEAPQ